MRTQTLTDIINQMDSITRVYNENTKRFGFDYNRFMLLSIACKKSELMMYGFGVAGSSVYDRQGRKVYFDIAREGLNPFVLMSKGRKYLKAGEKVRYFKDTYYTPVENWCSYAHYRNENDDLVVKPEILKLINQ